MRYLGLILLIILIGCQGLINKDQDNNGESLDSIFITKLIDINIKYTKGVNLTNEIKNEFNFLNYINYRYSNLSYIRELGYIPKMNFELHYNSKLYSKSVILTKKTIIDDVEGNEFRTFIYKYDERGKIISILNSEKSYLSYKFNYDNSKSNLISIIENNITEPMIDNNSHYRKPIPPKKYSIESKLEYLDDKIISSGSSKLLFFQFVSGSKTFIKAEFSEQPKISDGKLHRNLFDYNKYKIIYCFENGKCLFIAEYNVDGIYPSLLKLFDNNDSKMTISTYLSYDSDKGRIYHIREIDKIERSGDYKLERLTQILSPMSNETHNINDYYYRYNYSENNILLGYDLFLDKYSLSESEKNKYRQSDYKLIEQIYREN